MSLEQLCREWLYNNTVSSAAKAGAVGKYLVSFSDSLHNSEPGSDLGKNEQRTPPVRQKQLHILYLISDLLHYTKYHSGSQTKFAVLTRCLQPHVLDLIESGSSFNILHSPKYHAKVKELLNTWVDKGYFEPSYISTLQDAIVTANTLSETKADKQNPNDGKVNCSQAARGDAPPLMPGSHGDPSVPFYDLPAGNFVPHIIPNSTSSINPRLVKPLQFKPGPANDRLVLALEDFMQDANSIFENVPADLVHLDGDIDALGQPLSRGGTGWSTKDSEAYYGWSKSFCKRMKRRSVRESTERDDNGLNSHKRERYSFSSSSSSRDLGKSGSRSLSPSRSKENYFTSSHLGSRDKASSEKYGARHNRNLRSHSRSRSRSRSRSYSPPEVSPTLQNRPDAQSNFRQVTGAEQGFVPAPALDFLQHGFLGPDGLPIPPPPPQNYSGPWPPPPPPPLPSLYPQLHQNQQPSASQTQQPMQYAPQHLQVHGIGHGISPPLPSQNLARTYEQQFVQPNGWRQ